MRLALALVSSLLVAACGGKSQPGTGADPAAPAAAAAGLDKVKAQAIVDGFNPGEGWTRGMANAQRDGFMLSFAGPENPQGGKVNLIVAALGCMAGMCSPLDAAGWKAKENSLKGKLAAVHNENPALVWELAEADVDGKKVIGIYALSYVEKTVDTGTSRMSTQSYDLYWHNGATLVNVTANAGAFPQSLEELKTKVTRAELEAAAKKAMGMVIAKL